MADVEDRVKRVHTSHAHGGQHRGDVPRALPVSAGERRWLRVEQHVHTGGGLVEACDLEHAGTVAALGVDWGASIEQDARGVGAIVRHCKHERGMPTLVASVNGTAVVQQFANTLHLVLGCSLAELAGLVALFRRPLDRSGGSPEHKLERVVQILQDVVKRHGR